MNDDPILRSEADGLVKLTLNRPDKRNALNSALFVALEAHLERLESEADSVGAVILQGAGRCFSAGLDLAEVARGEMTMTPLLQSRTIDRIARLPQPVIAAVHGQCFTGALELALAADIILASHSASFADTHGRFGLTPAWGMSQRLPRRIGRGQAARMMFTGQPVLAPEALTLGLVEMCYADDAFNASVEAFARSIVDASWFSHRANKALMLDTDGMPLAAGLAHEFFRRAGRAPDFAERAAAFGRRPEPSPKSLPEK